MLKKILIFFAFFMCASPLLADRLEDAYGREVYPSTRTHKSRSDVNYSILKSTSIQVPAGGFTGSVIGNFTSTSAVTSKTIVLESIYVSSPGINSKVELYDNWQVGTSSHSINGWGDMTDTQGEIPYHYECSRGLVIKSTCATCTSPWAQPVLRVIHDWK